MTNIGKNIKLARQHKNLTQGELAEKLFVTRQTVSNYELGRTQPDVEMLLAIAKALDTDMETLIYGPRAERAGSRKRILVLVVLLLMLTCLSLVLRKIIQIKAVHYVVTPLVFWNGLLVSPGIWLLMGYGVCESLACLTKLAPRNVPHARLALNILAGVYLLAILPMLLGLCKAEGTTGLIYLLLATTPGHTGLRLAFLLLGIASWLFRSAPPREQSST